MMSTIRQPGLGFRLTTSFNQTQQVEEKGDGEVYENEHGNSISSRNDNTNSTREIYTRSVGKLFMRRVRAVDSELQCK